MTPVLVIFRMELTRTVMKIKKPKALIFLSCSFVLKNGPEEEKGLYIKLSDFKGGMDPIDGL